VHHRYPPPRAIIGWSRTGIGQRTVATYQPLMEGVRLFDAGEYERALPFFSRPALAGSAG
jgi:hypothetical protein